MKHRVLIVEDEDSILELLAYNFRKQGYEVSLARGGGEALALLRSETFDLLILDIMLPNVNGYELLRSLREGGLAPQVPVIYLSALSGEQDRIRGLEAGACDYVTKPFNIKELLLRAKGLVERAGAAASKMQHSDLLMREASHRMKNNMLVIQSLLRLQAMEVTDPRARDLLRQSEGRILSMSRVHELLYKTNPEGVDLAHLARALTMEALRANAPAHLSITPDFDLQRVVASPDDAVPFSLLLNEVVTNAVKHAYKGRDRGRLSITLRPRDGQVILQVADDGQGIAALKESPKEQDETMGMMMVRSLGEQLGGSARFTSAGGTVFTLSFPQREPRGLRRPSHG